MAGINTGSLTNAYPLSNSQIAELEKRVLENQETFVYLDENCKLCFALPYGIDDIKELAWNNAYEISAEDDIFVKKVYKKQTLKSFYLEKILEKQNVDDLWIAKGIMLKSSDNYILKDSTGLYITSKGGSMIYGRI